MLQNYNQGVETAVKTLTFHCTRFWRVRARIDREESYICTTL